MNFRDRYQYDPKADLLGKSSHSRTFKAYDTISHQYVVLKMFMDTPPGYPDIIESARKAVTLEHPNLCRYYDVVVKDGYTAFGDEERLQVVVMEYIEAGNIRNYVQDHPSFLNKLLGDVLQGISFLEQKGFSNIQLKPQDILVKNTQLGPVAKITDYAFHANQETGSSAIDPAYILTAEKDLKGMGLGEFSPDNADSRGSLARVYELISGRPFFTTQEQVMMNNFAGDVQEALEQIPEVYRNIVKQGLINSARQRIYAAEILIATLNGGAILPLTAPIQVPPISIPVPEQKAAEPSPAIPQEPPMPVPEVEAPKETAQAPFVPIFQPQPVVENTAPVYVAPAMEPIPERPYTGIAPRQMAPREQAWDTRPWEEVTEDKKNSRVWMVAAALLVLVGAATAWYFISDRITPKPLTAAATVQPTLFATQDSAGKWGYIDSTGKTLIAYKYDYADAFIDGMALVDSAGKFGFISRNDQTVIPFRYDSVHNFAEGMAVARQNGRWGAIDKSGNIVRPFLYASSSLTNQPVIKKEAPAPVEMAVVTPKKPAKTEDDISYDNDPSVVAQIENKFGFYNHNSQRLVIPTIYDNVWKFTEGLAAVCIQGKWGYIDKTGRTVIPLQFDDAEQFHNGRARVVKEGRTFYIDRNGNETHALAYQ